MILLILTFQISGLLIAQETKNDSSAFREVFFREIVIYGNNFENRGITFSSPEEAIKSLSQIKLISRGAFGLEPVINGLGDGPTTITIDGMKIHGACTDKMDPVSSYVEPENIGRIVLNDKLSQKVGVSATAGSINFVTLKPEFDTRFSVTTDNFYSSNGNLVKTGTILNYSIEDFAMRLSSTYKKSGDYTAGNNFRVLNSGFKKLNVKGDFSLRAGENNNFTFSYLGDFARDVGYPALIMDARKADGQLYSLSLDGDVWYQRFFNNSLKLYYNRVNHRMDDYGRSYSEIASRLVMPGMYMPMGGKFTTTGALFNTNINIANSVAGITAHFTNQRFYAEMEMISFDPSVPKMFMLNIGDAEDNSIYLGVSFTTELFNSLVVKYQFSGEYLHRQLKNIIGQQLNSVYEPDFNPYASYLLPSAGVEAGLTINKLWELKFSASYNSRAPLMAESYGYFLYNPIDVAFYSGNSSIRPESGLKLSVDLRCDDGHLTFFTAGNLLLLKNFIAGDYLGGAENNVNGIPFKQYKNAGSAVTLNLNSGISYDYSNFYFLLKATAQNGYSYYFADKLPLQQPTEIEMMFRYAEGAWYSTITGNLSFPQSYVSKKLALEKKIPGYFILNAEAAVTFNEYVLLYLTAENLFDKYYVTRYSINNLPMYGRNLRLGVLLKYK